MVRDLILNLDNTKDTKVDINEINQSLFKVVGYKAEENERINSKPYRYWHTVGRILFTNKTFLTCLVLLILIIILAIVVPYGKDFDPLPQDLPYPGLRVPRPPSLQYFFGISDRGTDYWLEIWTGTATTLQFTVIYALIQIVLGIVIGAIWGFYKKIDILMIEITRFITLIPTLALWFIIIFAMGQSYLVIIFAVSLTAWIGIATIVRVQVILVRNVEYSTASKMLGTSGPKIISRNIMPKILPVIAQSAVLAFPAGIDIDTTLSYFGFGIVAENNNSSTSLGKTLVRILSNSTWEGPGNLFLLVIPLVFIALISIIFFLFGKIFADSLDPRNHYK